MSCSHQIDVSDKSEVVYVNEFSNKSIEITSDLADVIRTKLSGPPQESEKGVAMGLDTRRYIRVSHLTFQVLNNDLVLMDEWGVRTWRIDKIETLLESELKAAMGAQSAGAEKITPK